MEKTHHVRTSFGSWHVEKVHAVVARSTFPSQSVKNWRSWSTFGSWHVEKVHAVVARSTFRSQKCTKTLAGVGHLKRIWKDAFRAAGAVQETHELDVLGGQGGDFLRGAAFGAWDLQVYEDDFTWQVQHSVWPGLTFSWQAQYLRDMDWTNRKTHCYQAVSSALKFPLLKEVSLVSFLMLPTWKIEEVSPNWFVFDVIKFKSWGSLAELLRFQACR